VVCCVVAGCQHHRYAQFDAELGQVEARRVFEPLFAGYAGLDAVLEEVAQRAVVFHLSAAGVAPHVTGVGSEGLDSSLAVFFYDTARGNWLYLEPGQYRVAPMTAEGLRGTDAYLLEPGRVALFRAMPSGRADSEAGVELDIYRFDFLMDAGQMLPVPPLRLTALEGADISATPRPEEDAVLFLHQEEDRKRIYAMGFAGEGAGPLLARQNFDVRYLRQLVGGKLVAAANPEGFYALYEVGDIQATRAASSARGQHLKLTPAEDSARDLPLTRLRPEALQDGWERRTFFAAVPEAGGLRLKLLALPEALGIEEVTALVVAHNPEVNRQRALVAAAVAESALPNLNHWPLINLGLSYEDFLTLFTGLPELGIGESFSRSAVQGMLGLVFPLWERRRDLLLTQAAEHRAGVAEALLEYEINERVTEAAGLFFEAQYLERLLPVKQAWLAQAVRRQQYYETRRAFGEALPLDLLATAQQQEALVSEIGFHQERLGFLKNRLKELTGLPMTMPLELEPARSYFDRLALPPLESLRQVALLNHPALEAVRRDLAQAYFHQQAGAAIRPNAAFSATYALAQRRLNRTVLEPTGSGSEEVTETVARNEETGGLGLSAQLPLAAWRAEDIHQETWGTQIAALELEQEREARRVQTAMEEALLDFTAAQRDHRAKKVLETYLLEKLRVARAVNALGDREASGSGMTPSVLEPIAAETEFLAARANSLKVELDLALRHAKLWREQGLAKRLPEELAALGEGGRLQHADSVWLWRTKTLLADDAAQADFAALLAERPFRRVYVYLYSAAELLADPATAERLRRFIYLASEQGTEIWALLGEPEWLEGDAAPLKLALKRVADFNAAAAAFEPRLAGIKLDIEPHAEPAWDSDRQRRDTLNTRYLELLRVAHETNAGALPLWVDVPVKFFREEHAALLREIEALVSGLTLMCYFDNEAAITKWSGIALDQTALPVEIGLELSDNAPEADSLRAYPRADWDALRERLMAYWGRWDNFAGMALHDFDGVTAYFVKGQP